MRFITGLGDREWLVIVNMNLKGDLSRPISGDDS